jgi:hypothetical protein
MRYKVKTPAELICEQIENKLYQKLTAGRKMAKQAQIAEPKTPYGKNKEVYTQGFLTDRFG